MQFLKKIIQKYGKTLGIIIFLVLAFISGNLSGIVKNNTSFQTKVLSVQTHVVSPTSTPIPTTVPITVINNIIIPTQAPTMSTVTPIPTQAPMPTSTSTPTPFVSPTETIPSPTSTVTSTPTPTPVVQTVAIDIDYAGEHGESTYTVTITSSETAWQVVQDAIGLANIQYTDYGGNLGIFITGLNGVNADPNQYYDFQVNGTSASVGVSSYIVQTNDVLKFVLTND